MLSGLLESDKALSAYELVDIFRDREESGLLPMSVYRILEFLEGEGLVHRLSTANKYVACSHITCQHDHEVPQFLICKQCFRVEEIAIPGSLIDTIAQSAEKAGFRLAGKQLEIDCVCLHCPGGSGADS